MSSLTKKQISAPKPIVGREVHGPNDKRMIKIGLVVGHSKIDQGAVAINGITEYEFNKGIALKAQEFAKQSKPAIVEIIFRDDVGIAGAYRRAEDLKCDCTVELHFNDFNSRASGTETLCSMDTNDVEFAHIVQKLVCQAFGRDGLSRGIKTLPRNARGAENVYAFPNGVNCLVEPFFGDNSDDMNLGMKLQQEYAEALVNACILWARKNDLI